MDASSFTRLELCAPLVYIRQPEGVPLWYNPGEGAGESCPGNERIFCFELDPQQGISIEPESGQFLRKLLFSGYAIRQDSDSLFSADKEAETVQVPAGIYLFTQIQGTPGRDECIELVMEQQKDGMWEKYKLRNLLYIRFLFEDGRQITQIFRPIVI